MDVVLLDTDVFSYLFKGDTWAGAYAELLLGRHLAVSFMTVAELYEWSVIRKWGQNRTERLEARLSRYIIIPSDVELCRLWGRVRGLAKMSGAAISAQDAWIAATALRHDLPLVTNNAADFENVLGLEVRTVSQ